MKKIGFAPSADASEKHEEDFFEKMGKKKKALIIQFIEANYTPSGSTNQKEFKTSAELEYLLDEMVDASISLINEVLNELGYKIQFLEGVPNWILYEKNLTEYLEIEV